MKKLFFFFRFVFFFPPKKSNEWMTLELFRGKEKKQKNTQKFGKKKIQATFTKKKGNFIKIWLNDRWTFPRKKKYTIFGFEWMNDQRPCPRKKKYGTFVVANRESLYSTGTEIPSERAALNLLYITLCIGLWCPKIFN